MLEDVTHHDGVESSVGELPGHLLRHTFMDFEPPLLRQGPGRAVDLDANVGVAATGQELPELAGTTADLADTLGLPEHRGEVVAGLSSLVEPPGDVPADLALEPVEHRSPPRLRSERPVGEVLVEVVSCDRVLEAGGRMEESVLASVTPPKVVAGIELRPPPVSGNGHPISGEDATDRTRRFRPRARLVSQMGARTLHSLLR